MKIFFKYFGICLGVIFLLSLTISNRPIFHYIYSFISPSTVFIQDTSEKIILKTALLAKKYSKKIFDNSIPKVKDSVDLKLSGQMKDRPEPLIKNNP